MKKKRAAKRSPQFSQHGKKPLTPEQLRQAAQYWQTFGGKGKTWQTE